MNFYYDPILGLQYTCIGFHILIDIDTLPSDTSIEEVFKLCREQGILFLDSSTNYPSYFEITNYKL